MTTVTRGSEVTLPVVGRGGRFRSRAVTGRTARGRHPPGGGRLTPRGGTRSGSARPAGANTWGMSGPGPSARDAADLAGGLALMGLRLGGAAARIALRPARVAARAPVVGPRLRRAVFDLRADGATARIHGRAQLESAVAEILAAPEV